MRKLTALFLIQLALYLICVAGRARAESEWPQFRGPGSSATVEDNPALPEVWSVTRNVTWETEIPGRGWSCPVVWGDRIFLTSVVSLGSVEEPQRGLYFGGERGDATDEHKWMVFCFDRNSGEKLWERVAHQGVPETGHHVKNTFASETPTTDGERVYAYFGNTGLFAYDLEGNPIWEREWEVVKTKANWGTAISPVVYQDKLIIVNDNEDQSFIEVLDSGTGKTVWRKDRDEGSNWSTPFVWENDLRTEIVTAGTDKVRSYDMEGNLLWTLEGMSKITVCTPFAGDGLLYIASGFVMDRNKPIYAIKPGASGDISLSEGENSNEYVVWSQPKAAPYIPSPIYYKGNIYVLLDGGFLTCYDGASGEEVYGKQRLRKGGNYTASPWAYNDKIFFLSEDGDTTVVKAGPEFEILGVNDLDEFSMSSPAIADGSLFVRTESKLYRIDGEKTPTP
ncbi:MAG: PQQ-binding-like beta-propeller repeat protein [Candidatus Omnitrophica bacterium]|nr:PQQ-binding-like beta-propeller repeat protein [Candidatus Omnitrophota bacterium]